MSIAPPPWWENLLLERPWPVVIALGWAAAVLAVAAYRRLSRRLAWAAIAAILLALTVGLLAWLVETDRESLIERTRQLVAHTTPLDVQKVNACFDSHASLIGPGGEVWLTHDTMLLSLKSAAKRRALHQQNIRRLAAEILNADRGRTELALTTWVGEQGEFPIPTTWLLTWQRGTDGQWRIVTIQWLLMRGQPPRFGAWR